jgi:hypothetical protein
MADWGEDPEVLATASFPSRLARSASRAVRFHLDKSVLHVKKRWILAVLLSILYGLRIVTIKGFFIVTYALAIYLLNVVVGVLTPQANVEAGEALETAEEFRPFRRRVSEFQAWVMTSRAIVLSLLATFCPLFDLPVFWPILLMYFFFLLAVTCRNQIGHMLRHGYVPVTTRRKETYGDRENGEIAV